MRLEGRGISFSYDNRTWILKNVNISIQAGEIVGLIGPSGCGKSTLGKILAGYERPQVGDVALHGFSSGKSDYNPVQLVLQHPEKAVNPRWKMKKILYEGWEPDEAILEDLGIEKEWLNRWPNELSGGELQRFCVARALGHNTRFLIADEMTTMLDAITQARLWNTVCSVASERNLGVLVISHEQQLLKRLCRRIIQFETINNLRVHNLDRLAL